MTTASANPGRVPTLEVTGAVKRFGNHSALRGIDLQLVGGEIYALLGPNGAGKTTLIRAISGRLSLDDGTVRIAGRPPGDPGTKRLFGLVPQAIALYPHLTARENLEVLGRLGGVTAEDLPGAVDRALQRIALEARADDLTRNLSGGMQRRLNIAAGTLHQPSLLLLDEPTVGVDIMAREDIHAMLRELRTEGLSILLTTHDMDQASELADRVGILASGRLLAQGPPADLVREIFADHKELILSFRLPPGDEGRGLLRQAGLEAVDDGLVWEGRLRQGLEEAVALGARLREIGTPMEELRVREPGLRGVFLHLTGQEMEQ